MPLPSHVVKSPTAIISSVDKKSASCTAPSVKPVPGVKSIYQSAILSIGRNVIKRLIKIIVALKKGCNVSFDGKLK